MARCGRAARPVRVPAWPVRPGNPDALGRRGPTRRSPRRSRAVRRRAPQSSRSSPGPLWWCRAAATPGGRGGVRDGAPARRARRGGGAARRPRHVRARSRPRVWGGRRGDPAHLVRPRSPRSPGAAAAGRVGGHPRGRAAARGLRPCAGARPAARRPRFRGGRPPLRRLPGQPAAGRALRRGSLPRPPAALPGRRLALRRSGRPDARLVRCGGRWSRPPGAPGQPLGDRAAAGGRSRGGGARRDRTAEERMTPPRGLRTFTVIWLGQVVSNLGSGMTGFSLGVWVYRQTGSATALSLITLFGTLPNTLLSPLAGALADRWGKRAVLLLNNFG